MRRERRFTPLKPSFTLIRTSVGKEIVKLRGVGLGAYKLITWSTSAPLNSRKPKRRDGRSWCISILPPRAEPRICGRCFLKSMATNSFSEGRRLRRLVPRRPSILACSKYIITAMRFAGLPKSASFLYLAKTSESISQAIKRRSMYGWYRHPSTASALSGLGSPLARSWSLDSSRI